MSPKNKWLLGISVVIGAVAFTIFGPHYLNDISICWKMTTQLIGGQNPHDLPHYTTYMSDFPAHSIVNPNSPNIVNFTNPVSLMLLLPFGFLTLANAKSAYLFTVFLAFVLCNFLSARLFFKIHENISLWTNILLLLLIIPFGFFVSVVGWGAPSFLGMLGITLFIYFHSKNWELLSGVALSLCLFKVHIFVLVYAALFWHAYRKRSYSAPIGLLSVIATLTLAVYLMRPTVFLEYLQSLDYKATHSLAPFQVRNVTIPNVLFANIFEDHPWVLFLPLIIALLAVGPILDRLMKRIDFLTLVTLLVPFSIALGPYAWGHDYIACLPLFYLAGQQIRRELNSQSKPIILVLTVAFINISTLWCAIPYDRVPVVFVGPVLLILFLSAKLLKDQIEQESMVSSAR